MDLVAWMVDVIARFGYAGIALLIALESVVPPIPSEAVLPLAGFAAARGPLSLWGVVAAATAGSVLGALVLYGVGRTMGQRRLRRWVQSHGRWVLLDERMLDRADVWFRRHGAWAVLVGRVVPGVRSFVSIPAGVARMPMGAFLAYTTTGSLAWNAALALLGHQLGARWALVSSGVERFGTVVWTALALLVGVALARRLARRKSGRAA